jgi:RNA polymerase sigma-70 factor (ECF subfamily)
MSCPEPTAPDEALGHGARLGCRECFARLYGRYQGAPARYVYETFVGDFDAALELEAEAWKRAFEFIGTYSGERPFRAWLLAIARHQALNFLRHRCRRPPAERVARSAVAGVTPLDRAQGAESLRHVSRLIRDLPVPLREPFYLRAVLDLPPRAISEVLGLPVSTVKGRLFLARKALCEALRPLPGLRQEERP